MCGLNVMGWFEIGVKCDDEMGFVSLVWFYVEWVWDV